MTTYFVTRHPGALDWAVQQGITVDQRLAHLDVSRIGPGDTVIGTLPVHLAAQVCERGAHYRHLSLEIPPGHRGGELSARDMDRFGARLEEYQVERIGDDPQ